MPHPLTPFRQPNPLLDWLASESMFPSPARESRPSLDPTGLEDWPPSSFWGEQSNMVLQNPLNVMGGGVGPIAAGTLGAGVRGFPDIVKSLAARATTRGEPDLKTLRRSKKTGQYIGAPPGTDTPAKVRKLRDAYTDRAQAAYDAGAPRGYFYEQGRNTLREAVPDPEYAARFGLTNAVTSSEAPVRSNVGWALRAHEQERLGAPLYTGLYPNQMRPHLEEVLRGADPNIGAKRQPYGVGLVDVPDPPPGLAYDAPNDRWEISSVFGPEKKTASEQQHEFLHNLRASATKELELRTGEPWTPHQAQEMNWAQMKATSEGKTPLGVAEGESISSSLPQFMFSHTWESAPGGAAKHLPELGPNDLALYHEKVRGALIDPDTGRDQLVGALGGDIQMPAFDAPGVYKGDVAPGTVSRSAAYQASGKLDPVSLARLDATEAVRATALGQEAYAGNLVLPTKSGGNVATVEAPFTAETAPRIEETLRGVFPDEPWGPSFALTGTPEGYQAMDLAGTRGFASKLRKEALPELERLGATGATAGKRVVNPVTGEPVLYEELPWGGEGKSPVTSSVLEKLDNPLTPNLPALADSPQMRGVMDNLAQVYQAESAAGRTPNVKIQALVETWAKEGLPGVRRLVERGLAPAAVLGVVGLGQMQPPDDRI